ncbi:MAG TPA: hypothetical protein VJV78_33945 [Polyangiales bacterium]|nr:hypothetical protein [Polyangiales bacterium]
MSPTPPSATAPASSSERQRFQHDHYPAAISGACFVRLQLLAADIVDPRQIRCRPAGAASTGPG